MRILVMIVVTILKIVILLVVDEIEEMAYITKHQHVYDPDIINYFLLITYKCK